jgi:hypothetical protein
LFFFFSNPQPEGTDYTNVEKTIPQPQQQPNKPQNTTQQQKQVRIKRPKNFNAQKNPQQQTNKKIETKVSKPKTS